MVFTPTIMVNLQMAIFTVVLITLEYIVKFTSNCTSYCSNQVVLLGKVSPEFQVTATTIDINHIQRAVVFS